MGFRNQPPYQVVVQTCHFAVACAICQLPLTMSAAVSGWWGVGMAMAFAGAKEWGWDMVMEPDTVAGSALDFSFYVLGCIVSSFVFWMAGRL